LKHPAFGISVLILLVGSVSLYFVLPRNKPYQSQIALYLSHEPIKINFDFNPAKRELFSLNLNNLNLTKYNTLAFTLKKADAKEPISVRIEFVNSFKEKSEVFVKNIPLKWGDYKIDFTQFKNITKWDDMTGLVFSVEEWNATDKKGLVFIDNVRVTK
jgi:hypothetical protein